MDVDGKIVPGAFSIGTLKALVFLISRVWVQVPVVRLVSFSKTLNLYCRVLWMGPKEEGLECSCVN